MKSGNLTRVAMTILCLQLALLGSVEAGDKAGKEAGDKQKNLVRIEKVGKDSSDRIIKGIKEKLTLEMAKNLVESISYCHENAIPLANQSEKESTQVTAVKRTSLKYRNPVNKPDELEEKVLREWEKSGAAEFKIDFVSETEVRYYRPLKIQAMCLTCHGSPQGELKSAIMKKYPDDKATGYKEGDLRGLIRISINPLKMTK